MGNIKSIRAVQYNQDAVVSLCNPIKSVKGSASFVAIEPVIAKTIKIIIICKLESIPQRFFNLSIKPSQELVNISLKFEGKKDLNVGCIFFGRK